MKTLKLTIAILSIIFLINYGFSENKTIAERVIYILIFTIIIIISIKKMFFNEKK